MAKNMARIENGVVVNIEWCSSDVEETDALKETNDMLIEIGDTYDGSFFYRNGEKILTQLEEEYVKNTELMSALQIMGVSL